MSTTNTTNSWYWYVRKKGRNWFLGLIDGLGVATMSTLDIEYWYDEIPDEITSDNDVIPIPREFEQAIISGCVYEAKRMLGARDMGPRRRSMLGNLVSSYLADFEDGIYRALHRQTEESQQPIVISPYDLRFNDGKTIGTKTPRTV